MRTRIPLFWMRAVPLKSGSVVMPSHPVYVRCAVVYTDDNINVSSSSTESEALFENSTSVYCETNRSRLDTIIDNADAILAAGLS